MWLYALPHTRPPPWTEGEPSIQQGPFITQDIRDVRLSILREGWEGGTADGTRDIRIGKTMDVSSILAITIRNM